MVQDDLGYVALALWKKLDQLAGDAALDEAQREVLRMRLQELQQPIVPQGDAAPAVATTATPDSVVETSTTSSSKAPKRVPFTM